MLLSTLFEFLHKVSEEFYELAADIENLIYEQPNTTLMKCRLFCEQLVKIVSKYEKIEERYHLNNAERIRKLYDEGVIEDNIYSKLEWIRKKGNRASHDLNAADIQDAINAHKFIFDISVWYMEVYISYDFISPIYELPKRKTHVSPNADKLMTSYVDQTMERIDSLWTEVNKELENIKREKKLIEKRDTEESKNIKKPYPILEYLEKENLTYIDQRDKGGVLWIIGDWSINEKINELIKYEIFFRFIKKGGKSTNYEPAWYMLNNTIPLFVEK